jgi:hypothetical protein
MTRDRARQKARDAYPDFDARSSRIQSRLGGRVLPWNSWQDGRDRVPNSYAQRARQLLEAAQAAAGASTDLSTPLIKTTWSPLPVIFPRCPDQRERFNAYSFRDAG